MPSNTFCVMCSKVKDTLPNGEISLETKNLTFSICLKEECHKKLADYIYDMCEGYTDYVDISYQGKKYRFPMDRRIINSLPSKIKLILQEKYDHKNGKKNGY